MKSTQAFRFKIFLPLFLLLIATSAISSAAATEALTSGRSAVPSTLVAILTSFAICALASQFVSKAIAQESRRLAATIGQPPTPPRGRLRAPQPLFFAEVAAAWEKAVLRWERTILEEQLKATRSSAELNEFLCTVAKATEERSPFMRGHAERVAAYSVGIAEEFELGEELTERIRLAAMVHDIGMIGIGEPVLKKGRLLGVREFEILRAHPSRGAAILRSIESLRDLVPAVELHHEAQDGSGYPYGLTAEDIPLAARILAVADTFDALIVADPHQAGMRVSEALDVLDDLSGTRLDRRVVDAFFCFLERDTLPLDGACVAAGVPFLQERVAEARMQR